MIPTNPAKLGADVAEGGLVVNDTTNDDAAGEEVQPGEIALESVSVV